MRILLWHVHGSWTTSFVQGGHTYLLPVVPDRGPDGGGRATTWSWPPNAVEVTPAELAGAEVDVVVLQRPRDEALTTAWLGRRPGIDVPAVWLEHNAPQGRINEMVHPATDRPELTLIHVTHTNALFWDTGSTPTEVIEHGVIDPGYRYGGDLARAAVVINEPERRARVTGTDLLPGLADVAPLDLFGMGANACAERLRAAGHDVEAHEDLPQSELHRRLARRRVYVHTCRWTSLGLSLIEAMFLGMPVAALATTEVPDAVPPGAGIVTNRVDRLQRGVAELCSDRHRASAAGATARAAAIERYGLDRFLESWDRLLTRVVRQGPGGAAVTTTAAAARWPDPHLPAPALGPGSHLPGGFHARGARL